MKKILALAVGMLLIPFTAFGMEAMSDGDMDSITGQSGVAISISNVQIYSDGGNDLWYETAIGDGATAQAVGILQNNTASFTFINAIADPSQFFDDVGQEVTSGSGVLNTSLVSDPTAIPEAEKGNLMLRGDYGGFSDIFATQADGEDYGVRQNAAVLSIRVVNNGQSVFTQKADTTVDEAFAAVEIGLPTMEIYNPEGSYDEINVVMWGGYDSTTTNPLSAWDDADLYTYGIGTIYTGGESTTALLGGRIGVTSFGQIGEDYKTYKFK